MQYPQDIYLRVTFHIITSMDKYENRRLQLEALVASIGHGGIKQVAEKIGKEPSYVSRMLYRPGKPGGKRIGEDTQEALQAAFSDWYQQPKRPTSQPYPLSEGDSRFPISESKAPYLRQISTWDNPDELPADQFVFLPHLDAHLSAGHGGPSTDAIETSDKTTPFRSDWVKSEGWNPRTHYTMRCKGDSMEPTIQDGAPVVIDTSASGKRVQSGRIYAISVDGETYLKRLDKLPNGMVRVRSDNATPMYAPYELAESAINIIGRAVWTPVRL